jgi:hypothetical protein
MLENSRILQDIKEKMSCFVFIQSKFSLAVYFL